MTDSSDNNVLNAFPPQTWIFDLAAVMIVGGNGAEREQELICLKAYGY